MSQTVPTIAQVETAIRTQLETQLTGVASLLPKAVIRVLAKVLAAVFIILYKYGSFTFLQLFVTSASFQETTINGKKITPLIEWGKLIGEGEPIGATQAEFDTDLVVLTQGDTLPAGTQVLSDDNSIVYISTAAVALDAATVTVPVRAGSDPNGTGGAGTQGNLNIGKVLNLVTTRGDVETFVTITAQTVNGSDAETEGVYRQRVSDRWKKRLQGGAYVDYEEWGELTPDIINVYPYTGPPGRMSIYSESSTEVDGIPTPAQLIAVKETILLDDAGLASRSPANVFIDSYPISRKTYDVTIAGLTVDGDIEAVKTLIEASYSQYILDREPYIAGLSVPPRKDRISQSAVGGLIENIVSANNGVYSGSIVKQGVTVLPVFSLGEGEKAKPGTVLFT